jgi:hypothetical protein
MTHIVGHGNSLSTVTLGQSITSIGGDAFSGGQLTQTTISDTVLNIKMGAFADNQQASVTLGQNLSIIEGMVFYQNQLTQVTIPNSMKYIGWGYFLRTISPVYP